MGHHHGSHTPTSPDAVLLHKQATLGKHFEPECNPKNMVRTSPHVGPYTLQQKVSKKFSGAPFSVSFLQVAAEKKTMKTVHLEFFWPFLF